jgi:hypothetical protein
MALIHKTLTKTTQYCKFWNDRIIEARFEIKRGHLTIISLYTLEEGRIEEAKKFYQ